MTKDEADDRYGSVNQLGWSKIIGRYNTPYTMEKVGHETKLLFSILLSLFAKSIMIPLVIKMKTPCQISTLDVMSFANCCMNIQTDTHTHNRPIALLAH